MVSTVCRQCGKEFDVYPSRLEHGRGKHCSKECHYAAQKGEGNPSWAGGITEEYDAARASTEVQRWKLEVYKRDGFKCRKCGASPSNHLNAHHILGFKRYPEARTLVDNGITLCVPCHKEFHRLYGILEFTDENLWHYIGAK